MISIKLCLMSEENNLGLHVRRTNEMLLKGLKIVGVVKTKNLMEKEDFKKNSQNERTMYGQFVREIIKEMVGTK